MPKLKISKETADTVTAIHDLKASIETANTPGPIRDQMFSAAKDAGKVGEGESQEAFFERKVKEDEKELDKHYQKLGVKDEGEFKQFCETHDTPPPKIPEKESALKVLSDARKVAMSPAFLKVAFSVAGTAISTFGAFITGDKKKLAAGMEKLAKDILPITTMLKPFVDRLLKTKLGQYIEKKLGSRSSMGLEAKDFIPKSSQARLEEKTVPEPAKDQKKAEQENEKIKPKSEQKEAEIEEQEIKPETDIKKKKDENNAPPKEDLGGVDMNVIEKKRNYPGTSS
ncbi:MAG: hypothetical protein NTW08_01015 [Gammaproteobacteria bacterium]|nr:hypothetical protein [Gammaproteobacteria bacterium]